MAALRLMTLCVAAAAWAAACGSSGLAGTDDAGDTADLPPDDGNGDAALDEGSPDADDFDDTAGEEIAPDAGDEATPDAPDGEDAGPDLDDEEDAGEPPLVPLFAFAIVTDSHVTGSGANADRLAAAVAWINANAFARGIEVVLVLGDIGWDGGLGLSRTLLDGLEVPYVPVTGDNEVHADDEEAFATTFADRYALLSTAFAGWQQAAAPVWNPEAGQESWFTNVAFEHRGVRFVGLDWAARGVEGLEGEMGDLHDFDGGTWRWFEGVFAALPKDAAESIVLFSHMPMHFGAFWLDEMSAIESLLGPSGGAVYADMAGHVHLTYERAVSGGGYVVYATDGTFDDENTLRLVIVEGNGARFVYTHELIVVD